MTSNTEYGPGSMVNSHTYDEPSPIHASSGTGRPLLGRVDGITSVLEHRSLAPAKREGGIV